MFDIGLELRDILKQIDGVSVCFAYPDNFNKLPAIAYYTLTDKGSMSYDNTVVTNDTTVQIDIYADYPQTCFELSERVYKLLTDNEYYHEMTMDVPNPDDKSIKHRTMRFTKVVEFQLTRSVGSVTLHIVYVKSHHHNRADILLKITLKIDIFYIICIIFSANLHIKPISLHVRSQNQTALRVICFLCTYMLHSPLPIITQIIESKAILFFINNFHKSIF